MSHTGKAKIHLTRAEMDALIKALAYYDTVIKDHEDGVPGAESFARGEVAAFRRAGRKISEAYQTFNGSPERQS